MARPERAAEAQVLGGEGIGALVLVIVSARAQRPAGKPDADGSGVPHSARFLQFFRCLSHQERLGEGCCTFILIQPIYCNDQTE